MSELKRVLSNRTPLVTNRIRVHFKNWTEIKTYSAHPCSQETLAELYTSQTITFYYTVRKKINKLIIVLRSAQTVTKRTINSAFSQSTQFVSR